MKPFVLCAFVLAAAAPAFADSKKKGGDKHPEGYTWLEDYAAARLLAAEEGKLLFIDFWSEG